MTDLTDLERASAARPCPACPDGYVWTANGPIGKTCPVCNGHAVVQRNGAPIAARIHLSRESGGREE